MASATNSGAERPAIAITMGDPCGIGPEVVVKALADPRVYAACRPVVVGNAYAMEQAAQLTGLPMGINRTDDPTSAGENPSVVDVVDIGNLNPEDITVGQLSVPCGKASMEWVSKAGQLAMAGVVDGLATAPLNKEAAALAGYEAIGHMELLQELSGAKDRRHHADGQEPAGGASDHPPLAAGGLRLREAGSHP